MEFNSLSFIIFFTTIFTLYWIIGSKNNRKQTYLILFGSYLFYAWAEWRFLIFLIFTSILTFYVGKFIEESKSIKQQKLLLFIGLLQGIGSLLFFKYSNLVIDSINSLFHIVQINQKIPRLDVLIPLGISFFTFRTLSYLLDIYHKKIDTCKDWLHFFTYVAFFPSLLAGPIDKSKLIIPQLEKQREFNYFQIKDGLKQILWGMFVKVVVADNCALIADNIFSCYNCWPAKTLLVGAFIFTIQVYADFSGYSNMAIGFSKLLGITITKNFNYPFFSQNIAEFWRRWHISLTSWLTEYLFTPLSIAFRNFNKFGTILAILINFTLIGLWHGPKTTYLAFGFFHGLMFIPLIIKGNINKKNKKLELKKLPSLKEFINILFTFTLVTFLFIIFKCNNLEEVKYIYTKIFSKSIFYNVVLIYENFNYTIFFIVIMFVLEWLTRNKEHPFELSNVKSKFIRTMIYYLVLLCIFIYSVDKGANFIYFQF